MIFDDWDEVRRYDIVRFDSEIVDGDTPYE